jgi:hypothetical protein
MADAIILCAGSRYWSDQRARIDKYGALLAKCLHPTTPRLRWTSGRYSCPLGEPDEAIDTPPEFEAAD